MSVSSSSFGIDPQGQAVNLPVSGTVAYTTTLLGAGGTWSSGWISTVQYGGAETTIYSDVDGTYTMSYSQDGGTTLVLPTITVNYPSANGTRKGQFPISTTWIKIDYTNGSTAQTKFLFKVDLLTQPAQVSAETLNAVGSDTRTAQWTKTRLETKTSDATNDYAPIYRQGNALRVSVDNPVSTTTSAISNFPTIQPAPPTGTARFITGLLGTTSTTANQQIGTTYTVPTGKVFYLNNLNLRAAPTPGILSALLGALLNTITNLGTVYVQTSTAAAPTTWTTIITCNLSSGATGMAQDYQLSYTNVPFVSGTNIRVVVSPAITTGITWQNNTSGFEA